MLAYTFQIINFDIIGYVVSVYDIYGLSGIDLANKTFNDIEQTFGQDEFNKIFISDFRQGVLNDHESLAQLIPFYQIRLIYIYTLIILSTIFNLSISGSIHIISAVSVFIIVVLIMRQVKEAGWAFYLFPVLFIPTGLLGVGRVGTPDAFAAMIVLIMLFTRNSYIKNSLFCILPLIRTDLILLNLIIFLINKKNFQNYVFIAFAFLAYFSVNAFTNNYGYVTIFNFTFIASAIEQIYPSSLQISQNLADYINVYIYRSHAMLDNLAVIGFIGIALLLRNFHDVKTRNLLIIILSFMFIHFALFPSGFIRFYVWTSLAIMIIFIQQICKSGKSNKTLSN